MENKVKLPFNDFEYQKFRAYLQLQLDSGEIVEKVEEGYAFF